MFDPFKIFRIFGILPYKIVTNTPVYCRKWHFYSYVIAFLILILHIGLIFSYDKYFPDPKDPKFIYLIILKFEPILIFAHCLVIYYTVLNKQQTRKAIKIVKLLLESISRKEGDSWERNMFWWTFGSLGILLILISASLALYPKTELIDWFDFSVCFTFTTVNTIQVVQFCVYSKLIIGAITELEISDKCLDVIPLLGRVKKLKELRNKIEAVYYPNLLFLELNCLIYCLFGFRGVYDLISLDLFSQTLTLVTVIWLLYVTPYQFYLMHLSEIIDDKVSKTSCYL